MDEASALFDDVYVAVLKFPELSRLQPAQMSGLFDLHINNRYNAPTGGFVAYKWITFLQRSGHFGHPAALSPGRVRLGLSRRLFTAAAGVSGCPFPLVSQFLAHA
jgi:hypothetical protein